jgi:hypothetical protein
MFINIHIVQVVMFPLRLFDPNCLHVRKLHRQTMILPSFFLSSSPANIRASKKLSTSTPRPSHHHHTLIFSVFLPYHLSRTPPTMPPRTFSSTPSNPNPPRLRHNPLTPSPTASDTSSTIDPSSTIKRNPSRNFLPKKRRIATISDTHSDSDSDTPPKEPRQHADVSALLPFLQLIEPYPTFQRVCANLDDDLDALAEKAQKEIMEWVRGVGEGFGVRRVSGEVEKEMGEKKGLRNGKGEMSTVQQKLRELDEQRAEKEKGKDKDGVRFPHPHPPHIFTEPCINACMG